MKKLLILLFPIFVSCENLFFEESLESLDPYKNFDYLWNQCDQKYSYFDLKGVGWLAIRNQYRAQLHEGMTQDELFEVMGAMLKELKDDHTNLISNFNVSHFSLKHQYQDNFEWSTIVNQYIGSNYNVSGPFIHNKIIGHNIGYIRFSEFTGNIDTHNLDYVLEKYHDTDGLILDLRENGGGAVTDVYALLSRFINQKTLVYYSQIKNGPGHNDFTTPTPVYVSPSGVPYLKKVMVLVDRGTYSAGSFTSLATKAIDNLVLVGDTTGGGLGLPNGGQLPNGWKYRFSISRTLDLSFNHTYENGVPADISAQLDWNSPNSDEIIDTALQQF